MTTQLELATLKRDWIAESAERLLATLKPRSFTADDLHPILPAPDCLNWFGALVATLKKRKLIKEIGWQVSKRPERNGARVILWDWV